MSELSISILGLFFFFFQRYSMQKSLLHCHILRQFSRRVLFIVHFLAPPSPPECSLTFSKRTDGRKAAWHSFLMVQLSGRGASSWFMVPTLCSGATGAQFFSPAPGSTLPHWGGKNERRSPTPTAREHPGPRAWPSKENHRLICHHLHTFTFPRNEALTQAEIP